MVGTFLILLNSNLRRRPECFPTQLPVHVCKNTQISAGRGYLPSLLWFAPTVLRTLSYRERKAFGKQSHFRNEFLFCHQHSSSNRELPPHPTVLTTVPYEAGSLCSRLHLAQVGIEFSNDQTV